MRFCVSVLLAILLMPSFAAAGDSMRFGIMPIFSRVDISDPDGSTEPGIDASALSGVVIFDHGRDGRIIAHAFSTQFKVDASTTDVGQTVRQSGINVSYQSMYRFTRVIRPWFGLGLGYNSERYQNRHHITPGGFLAPGSPYPSRSEEIAVVLANVSHEWQYDRDYDFGLHLQYERATSTEGAHVLRFGFYVVY